MAQEQRAVVYGNIGGLVDTRTVFTASINIAGGDDPEDYWTPYLTEFYDSLLPYISSIWDSTHYQVYVENIHHWQPTDVITFAQSGAESGQPIANAVAGVLIGNAGGIRHFGRKFISPLTEAVTTGNLMDSVLVTAMAEALLDWISPLTTAGGSVLTPGVLDASWTFHPFIGGTVSSVLGSIRKRKPGVGI